VIVARTPGGLRLTRQRDHAEQCAQFARHWGNDAFRRISPWGPLVHATVIHDDGWDAHDTAPEAGPDGLPIDFPELDRRRHIALYRAGIQSACAAGTRPGLIVSLHGQGLYEKRMGLDGDPPPRADRPLHERRFIEDQEDLRARLRADLPVDGVEDWEWAGYRLLQAWDALSLYVCWGGLDRGVTWRLPRVPRERADTDGVTLTVTATGDGGCTVDPWPFDGPEMRTTVGCVTIPPGPYAGNDDLRAAVAGAGPRELAVRIRPA
jgi:hypothetical protein